MSEMVESKIPNELLPFGIKIPNQICIKCGNKECYCVGPYRYEGNDGELGNYDGFDFYCKNCNGVFSVDVQVLNI